MANTVKKTTSKRQGRPAHSAFEGPTIGVIDNSPVKYLPNGSINPEWKKQQAKKK